MVQYAYASQDKEARRNTILASALTLFLEDTRRLPSVADIAAKAELAKGTVYLYFATKEEIFAALLAGEWKTFLAMIEESFAETMEQEQAIVARFIDRFVAFLSSHPYFMRLDSLDYGHLEASCRRTGSGRSRIRSARCCSRPARASITLCRWKQAGGILLLLRSYALARGLFQTLDFPDRIRTDDRFSCHPLAAAGFTTELRTAPTEYWQGVLACVAT